MSESKQNFDNKGEENDLSARISAVRESIEGKTAAEGKGSISSKQTTGGKPDISFGNISASTERKNTSAPKRTVSENKSAQRRPVQQGRRSEPRSSQASSSRNDNAQRKSSSHSADSRNSQRRTSVGADKASSSGKRRTNSGTNTRNTDGNTKPKSNGTAKGKPKAQPASAELTAGGKAKKGKFTKKQAATIVALVVVLFIVLLLIIVLIFNHYYNLLDTDKTSISNSTPMTYSDVDYSRSDTMDKAAEDEKLKELTENAEKISDEEVMNILLIGEDLRDTEGVTTGGNTDVMMIISVNTKDKTITLTSIMRDCYVYIPGHYSTRINAAYWLGGVDLTKETIETYMNVEIDRYVLVNFTTFIDIVDSLGGLDLYVSDEEANGYEGADPDGDNTRGMQNPLDEQNKYLGNEKGTDYLESGGNVHLNGNQALAYARLRHVGNSDYERTERQRKVIKEIIKKSRDLSLIEMDSLANEILPQIETDITKSEAAQLLIDMLDYRNYTLQEYRVPADGTFTDEVISGMDVLSVNFAANAEAFQELVYGTVEIKEDDDDYDYNYNTGWTE